MVEWDVFDDKPLPAEDVPAPRHPLPWRRLAITLLLLLAVVAGGVAIRYRIVREQLRADIQSFVTEEERALRFGISDRAAELADPEAPTEWQEWYRSTFQTPDSSLPPPLVTNVEQTGERYLVTIEYRRDEQTATTVRNYRLMTQGWRRTPITAAQWGELQAVKPASPFNLEAAARDVERMEAEQTVYTLNNFRAAWDRYWPVGNPDIRVQIVPTETLTTPSVSLVPSGTLIYTRSPLLNETPVFEQPTACSLGLIDGVAQVYSSEFQAGNEGQQLRAALRQSLTDYLLQNVGGLCFIQEQVRLEPNYAEVLQLPSNFGAYLIEQFGPQMLFEVAQSSLRQPYVEEMIASAIDYPYDALLYAIQRDLPLQPTLIPTDSEQAVSVGQVVARDGSDPIQFQVRFSDNTTATATAAETPFDACISLESEVTVTRNSDQSITIARVLDRRLAPRLNASPWPTTTQLVYTLEDGGNTQLTALTAEGAYQTLFSTEGTAELIPAPTGISAVAYLTTDTCGWALNFYNGSSGVIERYTTMENPPTSVFWMGSIPGVMYQEETEDGPAWKVYMLRDNRLQLFASNRGRLLGYNYDRGMLVVLHDSALHFAEQGRNGLMYDLPFRFTPNSEVSALSVDGRYLAYNVYPSDGRADLRVFDLNEMSETYLNTIPPSIANGESSWEPTTNNEPMIAVAGGRVKWSKWHDHPHLYPRPCHGG